MAPRRPDSEDESRRKRRDPRQAREAELPPAEGPDDYSDMAVTRARAEAKTQSDRATPGGERYEQNILDRSLEAQRRIKGGQTWTDWEAIAEAVRVITGRVMAETDTDSIQADAFKKAFGKAWRAHESLVSNEKDYRPITRQEIHDLRFLLDNSEVAAWRAKQKPQQQRRLLHPRTVIARWKAAKLRESGEQPTGKKGKLTAERALKDASVAPIEQAKSLLVAALKGTTNYERAKVMITIINAVSGDFDLMYRLNEKELLKQGKITNLRIMGTPKNEFVPEGDD